MLTFLLYTVLAIIANACMAKIVFFSIQDGQWLDQLFNWQYRLRKWDEKGKSLVKPLGYCQMCFSHLMAMIGFVVYCLFMNQSGLWALHNWAIIIIWYLMYIGIETILSLYVITKMFNKKK